MSPHSVEFALALATFIGTRDWHHFVTLTTDTGWVSDRLRREFNNRFVRRLAYRVRHRIDYFFATEPNARGGRFVHLHSLLYGTFGLHVDEIKAMWPHGFTDATPYVRGRGAADYLVKTVGLDPDSYDWSKRLPPEIVPWHGRVEEQFRAAVAAARGNA